MMILGKNYIIKKFKCYIHLGIIIYNFYMYREKRALILNEISLRKKALHDKNFPNQELIDEFLIRKDSVPTKLDIKWKQPQINQFIVGLLLYVL